MGDRRRRGRRIAAASTALLGLALVAAPSALGQASRTWVSGVGDDVNPCSRTAPCKTFAGAISKTATGGEISVLDPGGFGALTITKSLTISGNGLSSSILAAGQNGITVNGANIVVRIKDIEINGFNQAGGFNGIRFLQGKSLTIDNVDIYDFTGNGINMTAPARMVVRNSNIDNNGQSGIAVAPTGGLGRATVVHTSLDFNGNGLTVGPSARVAIRDCSVANNLSAGMQALNGGTLAIDDCTVQGNFNGIVSMTASSVRVQRSSIVDNSTGLSSNAGSGLVSRQDNTVEGNGTDGSFTGTYATK